MKRYYIFFVLLAGVSMAAVAGQTVMSGPVKADRELAERIQALNERIQNYYTREDQLPASLSEVGGDARGVDYRQIDEETYELCGTFGTANKSKYDRPIESPSGYIDAYHHDKGRQCFKGTAPYGGKSEPARP